MIELLFKWFFKNTVYAQIDMEWLSVKYVEGGKTVEGKPVLAIKKNEKGKI